MTLNKMDERIEKISKNMKELEDATQKLYVATWLNEQMNTKGEGYSITLNTHKGHEEPKHLIILHKGEKVKQIPILDLPAKMLKEIRNIYGIDKVEAPGGAFIRLKELIKEKS